MGQLGFVMAFSFRPCPFSPQNCLVVSHETPERSLCHFLTMLPFWFYFFLFPVLHLSFLNAVRLYRPFFFRVARFTSRYLDFPLSVGGFAVDFFQGA